MATKESMEYLVLHDLAADIASEIAGDPVAISAKLLEKGFISEAQHNSTKMQDKEEKSKANELVELVKRKVRLNSERFSSFINILSEFPWLKDIAELMQKKLDERTNLHSDKNRIPGSSIKEQPSSGVITDQRHQKLERIVRKQVEWGFASNLESVHRELLELFQKYITELPISQLENLKKNFEPTLQSKEGQKRESEEVEALRRQIAQQEEQIKQLRREMQLTEEDTQEETPQQSEEEDQTKLVESLRQKVDQQEKEIERLNKKKCIIL